MTAAHRTFLPLAVAAYAVTVIAANWLTTHYGLVAVGFGFLVTAGTFAAGAALAARDVVHRLGGPGFALLAVALGCVASYLLSPDPAGQRIAIASAVAFGGAELLDLFVFQGTYRLGFLTAVVVSNIASAPLDTLLFLWIAGFPVTADAVLGQLLVKLLWVTGTFVLLVLALRALTGRNDQHRPASAVR